MEHSKNGSAKTSDGHDYYDGNHELHPFYEYFDASATMTNFGMTHWTVNSTRGNWMTLSQFTSNNICGTMLRGSKRRMRGEAHAFIPHWEAQPKVRQSDGKARLTIERPQGWRVPEHIYKCKAGEGDCGLSGFTNDRSNPLFQLRNTFEPAKVVAHAASDVIMLGELPTGRDVPMLVIDNFFWSFNNTIPSYLPNGQDGLQHSMSHFVWAQEVINRAAEFIANEIGRQPFIAMHWRRGYSDGTILIRSLEQTAGRLRMAVARGSEDAVAHGEIDAQPPSVVYLATNKLSEAERKAIEIAIGPGRRVVSLLLSERSSGLDLNLISHVEMVICTHAKTFIKTPGSTWSYNVENFRKERGVE